MATLVEFTLEASVGTLDHFRSSSLAVDTKTDGSPVTVADRAAERLLRERIGAAFADDAIIGEEEDAKPGTSGHTWIIDPIDGTKAFTRGVPTYSTLVAVHDQHGPLAGAIAVPALGEMVWAARGLGCFHNGDPCHVSDTADLKGAFVSSSSFDDWSVEHFGAIKDAGASLRTWGDGWGFLLVATGQIDAMVDQTVSLWDIAPMPVILQEAGGQYSDLAGTDSLTSGTAVASNGRLHTALLDTFDVA